ncbi:MAG: serine/threonine-protein kinase [Chloroflexi bacterium]|nr:serine/threonine-protein kinase [Chloroflexota bacterium]
MGFAVGESVGPYKITEYIAQGGMATIFKAYQPTLDRYVALKVIHPALKEYQSFVARLKREAAIIAKLNHPNIVSVYDFGQADGLPYLVLQFVEGRTLKDVLREEKLSSQQILNIIRPVANALSFAHDHGVLHRDVKPSNILINAEGHVYLTDFGLARITQSGESTLSQDLMVGSPQYISPEQARGENVNASTDIYSLGVVMYEMFTRRVPFQGDTPYATILAHIGNPPPPPRSINPQIRPVVEQVLLKALAKEPKDRYRSTREMSKALENAVKGPREDEFFAPPLQSDRLSVANAAERISSQISHVTHVRRLPWQVIAGTVGVLLLLCLVGSFWIFSQASLSTLPGATTNVAKVASPAKATATVKIAVPQPTVAPTFTLLPTIQTTQVPPTPLPTTPVPAPPTAIAPTATAPRPTAMVTTPAAPVAARGRIAYSVGSGDIAENHSIWLANADGSNPQKIMDLALWPAISPDGHMLAYYRMKDEGIYVSNLDGSNPRIVTTGETCCVQWSRDGKRLAYFNGKLKFGGSIFVVNIDGTNKTEITRGFNPSWSPDGTKIAYSACETNTSSCGIHIYDLVNKVSATITRDNGQNPQWSPQGSKIVYQAGAGGGLNVFVVNADGSGLKQLTSGKGNDGQPAWSSDSNFIFWRSDQDGKAWGIFSMRADGSDKKLLINNVMPDAERWGRESLTAGP